MKNLIFIFSFFCSLFLNAQMVSGAEKEAQSVSVQEQTKQSKDLQDVTAAIPDTESNTEKKTIQTTDRNTTKENSSLTTSEGQKTESHFKRVLDTIDTSVELGLEYPMSFGVHGKFHVNDSIYTRLGFGFTPKFFVGTFERIAPALGYMNGEEANLIGDVIQNSLFGAIRLGWLPYTKKVGGPYMELGLLGLAYGQGEASGTALNGAIGTDLNEEGANLYSVKSNLLSGTFHVGYQIPIEKHIHLNLEMGILKIFFVEMKETTKNGIDSLPKESHEDFKRFLTDKGWIFPTLSAWIGFSF